MPQFRQANGLTCYSFACGYIQRAELKHPLPHKVVDLIKDGCWHIKGYDYGEVGTANGQLGQGRLFWETLNNITEARTLWERKVREVFKDELLQMAKDHRYTYTREYHGEAEPSWITRFGGEWVDKSDTRLAAMLKGFQHWKQHVVPPAAPVA